jgi:hypothetical protein
MPFRIPKHYEQLNAWTRDPTIEEAQMYADWLKTELQVAGEYIAAEQVKEKKAEAKKKQ